VQHPYMTNGSAGPCGRASRNPGPLTSAPSDWPGDGADESDWSEVQQKNVI
jgi:hypothetical protein